MRPTAVIIDIDGVLAQSQRVTNFSDTEGVIDWTAWMESNRFAPVNEWCRGLVNGAIVNGHRVIFMTGRTGDELGRSVTEGWLRNNGFSGYDLLMRADGDKRQDSDIKRELYLTSIASNYEVVYAIDDKRAIVDMWRELGLTALHCADY